VEVLHLSLVDSTSTYAAELLAQGKAAPFLVHADVQTSGRGRRGNRWDSPQGNLYATIALPAAPVAAAQAGLLPLKAGVILAQLLHELIGLRLTLKWPNDFLFGGRKLGGLLLESSISAGRFGDLLIGFGLNCATGPQLEPAYATTCLRALLGRDLPVAALVHDLAQRFIPAWDRLPLDGVVAAYGAFAVAPGHMFSHPQAGVAALVGLAADGSLRLQQSSGAELLLSSADHSWRWLQQQQAPAASDLPLLVADVGNSAIKLASFGAVAAKLPAAVERWSYDQPLTALDAALRRLVPPKVTTAWPLFIASVRPQASAQLAAAAATLGLSPQHLAKRPVRCSGKNYAWTELGFDRLAGIEAWLAGLAATKRTAATQYAIIVQAGTATTIDAVCCNGEHLGGLILPGVTLALSSLHQAAALLPKIEATAVTPQSAQAVLGSDTQSAMISAAVTMTVGAVERVARRLAQTRALQLIETVVSGGWALLLAPHLKATVDTDLVVKGIRVMAVGGSAWD